MFEASTSLVHMTWHGVDKIIIVELSVLKLV